MCLQKPQKRMKVTISTLTFSDFEIAQEYLRRLDIGGRAAA